MPYSKRQFWVTSLAAFAVLLVVAMNGGGALVVDSLRKADVILVLAGGNQLRPERGLELLRQGYGNTLLVDIPSSSKLYGFSEIELAERYFEKQPEAKSIQVCPIEGLSTREEALDAEKCLELVPGKRVLIVTSDFHTRRALSIFDHVLPARSFSVTGVYDNSQFGTHWWQRRQWAKTCLDEWLKLLWWNFVDRWR